MSSGRHTASRKYGYIARRINDLWYQGIGANWASMSTSVIALGHNNFYACCYGLGHVVRATNQCQRGLTAALGFGHHICRRTDTAGQHIDIALHNRAQLGLFDFFRANKARSHAWLSRLGHLEAVN